MKAAFFSLLAVPALFLSALAAPAPVVENAVVEKRSELSQAMTIVQDLYTEIQQYTGAMNTTSASITSTSTKKEKKAAAQSNRQNVKQITAAVKAATAKVKTLTGSSKLARRQTGEALAELIENVLLEISGALNNVIASLGLSSFLGSLNPLVSSLSNLLLSLEVVVNNLLALVKQLVDGLLTGLSIGLSGLNL